MSYRDLDTGASTSIEQSETAVAIAGDLLRIDTSNPGATEDAAAAYIANLLAQAGIVFEVVESDPGRCSVIARHPGRDLSKSGVVIHGHLDVVPAHGEGWTYSPTSGALAAGCLWGRGALDMKGGVAMMLAAELELSTRIPDRDLIFAYFADEEMGGGLGSAWLVANRPELFDGARWAIGEIGGFRVALPDGRGVYPLQVAEKGMLWVRISVPGVSGHAAFSTGPNPVVRVGELVDRITKLPANATTPPGYDAMIRDLADLGVLDPAEPDASLRELGGFWAAAWWGARTKYTPTVVTAGDNLNVVPDFATLQVDCRFVPGDGEAALERLRTVLDDDMSLEVLIQSTALESPIDSELVQHVRQAVANADPTGVVVPFVLPAGTDAQELAKLGIAGYGFMPLMLPPGFEYFESMHAIDEHVPVDALVGGYQILRHLVLGL